MGRSIGEYWASTPFQALLLEDLALQAVYKICDFWAPSGIMAFCDCFIPKSQRIETSTKHLRISPSYSISCEQSKQDSRSNSCFIQGKQNVPSPIQAGFGKAFHLSLCLLLSLVTMVKQQQQQQQQQQPQQQPQEQEQQPQEQEQEQEQEQQQQQQQQQQPAASSQQPEQYNTAAVSSSHSVHRSLSLQIFSKSSHLPWFA